MKIENQARRTAELNLTIVTWGRPKSVQIVRMRAMMRSITKKVTMDTWMEKRIV